MNMVNEIYPDIPWILDKNGELKKENYDACDSLICALAYVNINHHGVAPITITGSKITEQDDSYVIEYTTEVWDRKHNKKLILMKPED